MVRAISLPVVILVALGCLSAQEKSDKKEPSKLKLKVTYTGSGTVDAKHPVIAFLFDTPDFTQGGVIPFASKSLTSKTQTVVFEDITADNVYIATAFTPDGSYDGQSGPPPSGASMGLYGKTPGTPDPVKMEPGKTSEAEVTFDDTAKMP
jgi:hypothetical protein